MQAGLRKALVAQRTQRRDDLNGDADNGGGETKSGTSQRGQTSWREGVKRAMAKTPFSTTLIPSFSVHVYDLCGGEMFLFNDLLSTTQYHEVNSKFTNTFLLNKVI